MQFDMVFEGGGAKGIVFIGALQKFVEAGHEWGRLMGTSAGAITAALLATGYSPADLDAIMQETVDGKPVMLTFMDTPRTFGEATIEQSLMRTWLREEDNPFLPNRLEERMDDWIADSLLRSSTFRHIFSLVERGGWFAADSFEDWLTNKLNHAPGHGGAPDYGTMTLAEFYAATERHLSLVAADTTAGRLLVLNHKTAPNCPLVMAVRMSMSIPLLWQEVVWQAEWGPYMGRDLTDDTIVDGGVLSSFPIELFIARGWERWMDEQAGGRILGLLIDEQLEVPGQPARQNSGALDSALGYWRTGRRLLNLINTMMQARDKEVIEANRELVVSLPARGYDTVEFAMTDARRTDLIAAGAAAMQAYLTELGPEPAMLPQPAADDATRITTAEASAERILGGW
ncbi:MAG: patatin-like phospholipase family protein [Caldilineaceae bacterium]|nr:patatin-like phospholipase family protein [Caldilineaceae bacterium]